MNFLYQPRDISVIISTYTMARWKDIVELVESLQTQSHQPGEIILVADHNLELFQRIQEQFPLLVAVENNGVKGAGPSRNCGAKIAKGSLLAFIDDDAIPTPNWIEKICEGFTSERILGVGGFIQPLWLGNQPQWFPREFFWVIGASYQGMPEKPSPVRNMWSGNLCVRRDVFETIDGFHTHFGKIGSRSNPEDTEFCIRALKYWENGLWFYMPEVRVFHKVPPERTTLRYFVKRCYYEGSGKAGLVKLVGTNEGTYIERKYVLYTLSKGVLRHIGDALLHGKIEGVYQALAIIVGLTTTLAGFLFASLKSISQ